MGDDPVRILLVDDDEDDYFLTRDLLADIPDSNFQLDWLANPEAALEAIRRREYDMLLIDYRLGRTDGLSLLREAIKQGCSAPMILLTGQGERALDLGAMQAGAADFLEKGRLDAASRSVPRNWRLPTRRSKPRSPSGSVPRKPFARPIAAKMSSC
jgi:two-component system, cell cycle sensor histidine kinase and response regulator CckA